VTGVENADSSHYDETMCHGSSIARTFDRAFSSCCGELSSSGGLDLCVSVAVQQHTRNKVTA
jgi:hypothetical protein